MDLMTIFIIPRNYDLKNTNGKGILEKIVAEKLTAIKATAVF